MGILLKMIRNCEFYHILYLATCVRQTKFSGTKWIKNFKLNDLTDRTRNRTCPNFFFILNRNRTRTRTKPYFLIRTRTRTRT